MIEKIKKWNEWWANNSISKAKTGIKRVAILTSLLKLMPTREILVLSGSRRSGKSTLMYQLIEEILKDTSPDNIFYFNFDDVIELKGEKAIDKAYETYLELKNPKGRKFLFFDEIQNISDWERWVKKTYDQYGKEIKFILTGSNNSLLYDKLSTLLTGRIFTKKIFPLSFKEFLSFSNIIVKDKDMQKTEINHVLMKYLHKGGYPEVALEKSEEINAQRLKEYHDGMILRDIIQPNNIREVSKIVELVQYCMTNISAQYSYNTLSKVIGLNITSLKEYLRFLENAYLIFQLRFFSYSLKESISIQKQRKIYCIDNGLRNAVSFKFSKDYGKLAENLVFIELNRRDKEVYYWKGKKEVDFVVKEKDQGITAINVSYTDEIDKREIESLFEFRKEFKKTRKLVLITKNLEKKEEGITFTPLWKWLLE